MCKDAFYEWICVSVQVFFTSGIHLHDTVKAPGLDALSEIRELAGKEGCVAIGETGLDYFRMHSPKALQLAFFRGQGHGGDCTNIQSAF